MRAGHHHRSSAGAIGAVYPAPAVLLLAPRTLGRQGGDADHLARVFTERAPKRRAPLATFTPPCGKAANIPVFRTVAATPTDGIDGVHLDAAGHAALGRAVAAEVERLLPPAP